VVEVAMSMIVMESIIPRKNTLFHRGGLSIIEFALSLIDSFIREMNLLRVYLFFIRKKWKMMN